jgi:TrmH family RNA methyltransferase
MGERLDVHLPIKSNRLCIILVKPQFDGNIGAVARAMLNFGVSELRIVGRETNWSDETRNRAKHAQSVLNNSVSFDTIASASHDCSLVVGTSGKREFGKQISFRHFIEPEELPARLSDTEGKIGLVFGPEGIGLLNDELNQCDLLISIPTWEGYPIMNLSHAVSVICYVWYSNLDHKKTERLLHPDLKMKLRNEINRLTELLPSKDHTRKGIEETLFRVIMRGLPKDDEIHRLIGIIKDSADSFENL